MPPSTRYTLRLPAALDAQVQAYLSTTGTPFAVLMRDALSAYLADTPPPGPLTAADTRTDTLPTGAPTPADTLQQLQEQLSALTTRVEILEQMRTPRRQSADRALTPADSAADTPLISTAACPPFDATKNRLGRLCPRGHEWGRTGQTLLRLPNQTCRQCENQIRRERRAAQRQSPP